jgi:hypothetical protein
MAPTGRRHVADRPFACPARIPGGRDRIDPGGLGGGQPEGGAGRAVRIVLQSIRFEAGVAAALAGVGP